MKEILSCAESCPFYLNCGGQVLSRNRGCITKICQALNVPATDLSVNNRQVIATAVSSEGSVPEGTVENGVAEKITIAAKDISAML
jgi:hypothetical protein